MDIETSVDVRTSRNGVRGAGIKSQTRRGSRVYHEGHSSRSGSGNGIDADINPGLNVGRDGCMGCKCWVDTKR